MNNQQKITEKQEKIKEEREKQENILIDQNIKNHNHSRTAKTSRWKRKDTKTNVI